MMQVAVVVFACVLAALRFGIDPHPVSADGTYEAVAHLFVGGLVGAAMTGCKCWQFLVGVAVTISLVEVVAAVLGRL